MCPASSLRLATYGQRHALHELKTLPAGVRDSGTLSVQVEVSFNSLKRPNAVGSIRMCFVLQRLLPFVASYFSRRLSFTKAFLNSFQTAQKRTTALCKSVGQIVLEKMLGED
eukprot:4758761-Amphidinium_carterae.2